MRRALSLIAVLGLIAPSTRAWAGPKEDAAKHIEAATQAHSEEKYDVALTELEAAYKLDPDPELLYAIGQVHSKLGHCDEAASYYERYQKTNKDAQVKAVIDQAIAGCQPTAKPTDPTTNPTTPETENPNPNVTDPTTPPPGGMVDGPRGRSKVPYILAGGGALLGLISIVVYTDARSDLDAAEKAPTEAEYNDLVDGAGSKRTISVLLVTGGVALIGAGVVMYMLDDGGKESRGLSISPTTSGAMVTWSGSFR